LGGRGHIGVSVACEGYAAHIGRRPADDEIDPVMADVMWFPYHGPSVHV
jgi:hypothetical protein